MFVAVLPLPSKRRAKQFLLKWHICQLISLAKSVFVCSKSQIYHSLGFPRVSQPQLSHLEVSVSPRKCKFAHSVLSLLQTTRGRQRWRRWRESTEQVQQVPIFLWLFIDFVQSSDTAWYWSISCPEVVASLKTRCFLLLYCYFIFFTWFVWVVL